MVVSLASSMPEAAMKVMPATVERAPLTIIGSWRPWVRRRWMARASWIAPESDAQAPKATRVAPAVEAKAATPIATTARELIPALTRRARAEAASALALR